MENAKNKKEPMDLSSLITAIESGSIGMLAAFTNRKSRTQSDLKALLGMILTSEELRNRFFSDHKEILKEQGLALSDEEVNSLLSRKESIEKIADNLSKIITEIPDILSTHTCKPHGPGPHHINVV